jgi:general secretion pathway protein D
VDMTPTVTLEGDIRLDLTLTLSTRKADVIIAGVNIPSFGNREVTTRLRLRDGESNLLAGLLQETERKALSGFPGAIHVPVLSQLFSANDQQIDQTDIVMLLTPHIIRTHEITEDDLKPIYIGSQQNLGLNGPPPLIAPPAEPPPVVGAAPAAAGPPTTGVPSQPNPLRQQPAVMPPPGTTPVPGTVPAPAPPPQATPAVTTPAVPPEPAAPTPQAAPATPTPPEPPPATPPAAQTTPAAPVVPNTSSGVGSTQIIISPPSTAIRVGGGPYTFALSVTDASRLSSVTLTLIFDPTKLRVTRVQEGSFMRMGGTSVTFTQQVSANRIDITIVRSADATGASGTGVLAAVLFEAIAAGPSQLSLSGTATGPGGTAMGLRMTPVTVTVQQ